MPIPTRSLSLRGQSKQVSVANQNKPPVQPATQSVQLRFHSRESTWLFSRISYSLSPSRPQDAQQRARSHQRRAMAMGPQTHTQAQARAQAQAQAQPIAGRASSLSAVSPVGIEIEIEMVLPRCASSSNWRHGYSGEVGS